MLSPIEKKISKARVQMLLNMPFFGMLALHLDIKELDAKYCKTAGTDGKHFYYNKEFIESLDDDELKFLFAHEVMHCCYEHMYRRGMRDPEVFNQAADYVINLELSEQKVGKLINRPNDTPPCVPCYDTKYSGMTTDEIYEILINDLNNGGTPETHSFDVHFDPDDLPEELQRSSDERALDRDTFRSTMIDAAKRAGRDSLPPSLRAMIDEYLDPQMDWRDVLNSMTQSLVKSDFTFSRPNRKNSALGGIMLPGNDFDDMVRVSCAIDTSGSISEAMILEFLSEVHGIMEQFSQFELKVWCFDTSCYTIWTFTHENADELDTFYPEGGGGTMFECIWEMMEEKEIEPDQLIVFTDGYPCGDWGNESYQENLIYLISGDSNHSIEAPIGITLHYD